MAYVAPTILETRAPWWRAHPSRDVMTLDHQVLLNRMELLRKEGVRHRPGDRVPDVYFHDVPVFFDSDEFTSAIDSDRYIVASSIFMRKYHRALQRGRYGYEFRKWDARKTRRQRKGGALPCR